VWVTVWVSVWVSMRVSVWVNLILIYYYVNIITCIARCR
jgi:hypothetical protein